MAQTITTDLRGRRPSGAVIALVIGAVAMILGPFLTFATIEVDFGELGEFAANVEESDDIGGWDTTDGKFYFGLAIALGVFGIIIAMATSPRLRRALGITSLVVAAISLLFAIIDVADLEESFQDELGEIPPEFEQFGITFDISTGLGLWLVLAGSALATLAALVIVFRPGPTETITTTTAAPPPPPPPPATTTRTTTTETRETPPST